MKREIKNILWELTIMTSKNDVLENVLRWIFIEMMYVQCYGVRG